MKPYPFGTASIYLGRALLYFEQNEKYKKWDYLEYPDYADIPESISHNLGPDEVDYIQDNWDEIKKL